MSRPVRILSIGSLSPEHGGRSDGGVARCHEALLESFQRLPDLEIRVVGIVGNNVHHAQGHTLFDTVPVYCPPAGQPGQWEAWYQTLVERLAPDAVVFHHVGHRWSNYHLAVAPPIPFLAVIHSWHPITFQPPEKAAKNRQMIQRALAKAHGLIAPSRFVLEEGRQLHLRWDAAEYVVPNPVNPIYAQVPFKEPSAQDRLIFIGSLIERKNVRLVIEAAARMNLPALIIGEGPEETALKALARTLGAESLVSFVGQQQPQAIAAMLTQGGILCVPSQSESFGIVYIEALACGVPVIGFAPALEEIEQRLGTPIGAGLPGDAQVPALCEAIAQVRNQAWDRAQLRRNTWTTFSPDTVAAGYGRAIHQALPQAGTPQQSPPPRPPWPTRRRSRAPASRR